MLKPNHPGPEARKLRDARMLQLLEHMQGSPLFRSDTPLMIPLPQCVKDATKNLFKTLNPVETFFDVGPFELTGDDRNRQCYATFKTAWGAIATDIGEPIPNAKKFQAYMEQLKRPDGTFVKMSQDKVRLPGASGPVRYYAGVKDTRQPGLFAS